MPTKQRSAMTRTMGAKPTASAVASPSGKAKRLELDGDPVKTKARVLADHAVGGVIGNTAVMHAYAEAIHTNLDFTECWSALTATVSQVNAGDLSAAESMLVTQAIALNAMFVELARRAHGNMGKYPDHFERYLRLALKSQGQCRATLETLATVKNPPTVFARQANINNGGQQQVNNGSAVTASDHPSRAQNTETAPSKLLENSNDERLDTGATTAASGTDPQMATVGAIDRSEHR